MTDRNRVKGAHTTQFAIYPNIYLQDDVTYIRILIKHVPIRGFHYATGQEYTLQYDRKCIKCTLSLQNPCVHEEYRQTSNMALGAWTQIHTHTPRCIVSILQHHFHGLSMTFTPSSSSTPSALSTRTHRSLLLQSCSHKMYLDGTPTPLQSLPTPPDCF